MSWTLDNITEEQTRLFIPTPGLAKVLAVYDGDTITVAKCIDTIWYRFVVRVRGIDTPEVATKNLIEKQHGLRARDYLEQWLQNQIVELTNVAPDKYGGRFVATVTCNQSNVAHVMINKGLAVAYDGKKKMDYDPAHYFVQ
jgi:endonuclease YncB( thermonuclease family)